MLAVMSMAERIMQEIVRQQMLQVYSDTPAATFRVEFKANAAEQLEAVIGECLVEQAREYLKKENQ